MRIGVIAPVWGSVPPAGYGGIELVVSLLTEELVARGHDVTLFASGDSRTKATLVSAFDEPPSERMWAMEAEAMNLGTAYRYAARAYADGEGFDIIHDHSDYLGVAFGACLPTPVMHTVHMPLEDPSRRDFLEQFRDDVYLAAVSDHQRRCAPDLRWSGRVHNAVDLDSLRYRADDDGYLLCLGRIAHRKGQDVAIEVAREAGLPLVLAGRVHPNQARFFQDRILPHIDGEAVSFLGEVPMDRKLDLLAGARALLFPAREPEPFGLVMVEALASVTPVIGEPRGAIPEIVRDGETGFLAEGVGAMAEAVGRTGEISSERCRDDALRRFTPSAMVDGYEGLYREILTAL